MPSIALALLALVALLSQLTSAHSWIEEYQVISPDGSYVGARGYSRGYVDRTDPTYNGFSMMWMLPSLEARTPDGGARTRINSEDLVCHPAQRTSNYTADFPKLKVKPGDYVSMKYLENGHVTLPWNITGKPPGTGTVFVFGTTQPKEDERIADVMEWNKDGSGGNKNGFLMTAQNFDDGRCHQINCGSISQQRQMLEPNHVAGQPTSTVESWCETDLKIPESAQAGSLTTYWVWQWPTEPNQDCNTPAGKDEYYTTCADFDVVAGESAAGNQKVAGNAPFSASAGQNPQSVAVKTYKSRTAYTTAPAVVLQNNNKIAGAAPVNTAFVSSCSQQASVISANNLGMWPEVFVPNTCSVVSTFGPQAASAAAAEFGKSASSYSAGSSSAWSAAFANAKVPLPTKKPWSLAPSAQPAPTQSQVASMPAQTGSAPSAGMPASSTNNAAAPPYPTGKASGKAPAAGTGAYGTGVMTRTTLKIVTSTLPPGQAPPSQAAPPAAPLAESSATAAAPPAASSAPAAAAPPVSSSAQAAAAAPSSAPAAANPYNIQTISTVGGAPPAADAASSAPPYAPTVAADGAIGKRREHPRKFVV